MVFHMTRQDIAPETTPSYPLDVQYDRESGWTLRTTTTLTDAEAKAITFRATPAQVILGDFVKVIDHQGTRIGCVKTATFHTRWNGPNFVVVTIEIR